ncbi:hypothetical protein [Dysgonomonas sp. ZJ279]|uniref:hypothetical protein n=1 Tax=Dysgonomonas sp. ZJ279 TaxID=2709796 RepID=UPI0013E9C266|nr:hypothetical protein [Dysgonomonas sp. ZJ279]
MARTKRRNRTNRRNKSVDQNQWNFSDFFRLFLRKLSTTAGIITSILALITLGFTLGKYYSDFKNDREINEKTLEFIEKYNGLNSETRSLKSEIQLISIDYKHLQERYRLLELENVDLKDKFQ